MQVLKFTTKFFVFLISLFLCIGNVNSMCWYFKDDLNGSTKLFSLRFEPEGNDVNIVITCSGKILDTLSEGVKSQFQKSGNEFRYSKLKGSWFNRSWRTIHGFFKETFFEVVQPCQDDQKLLGFGTPQKISVEELKKIIKTKKIVFYTGAGISAGAVPVMEELEYGLGITEGLKDSNRWPAYIEEVINHSDRYSRILCDFFDRCKNAKPSLAHVAIAKIIRNFGHLLVTENVDELHQKTGLKPVVFPGKPTNKKLLKSQILSANFIITIGLNTDEGGFLKWCKKINPAIKIISINLKDTCYLSSEDFSLKGDVQKVLLFQ